MVWYAYHPLTAVRGPRAAFMMVTFFQVDADVMEEGLDCFLRLEEVVNSKHAGDGIILQLFPPLLLPQQGSVLKVSCNVSSCRERQHVVFCRRLLISCLLGYLLVNDLTLTVLSYVNDRACE